MASLPGVLRICTRILRVIGEVFAQCFFKRIAPERTAFRRLIDKVPRSSQLISSRTMLASGITFNIFRGRAAV